MTQRYVNQLIQGRPTSDGAGVKLTRVFSLSNKLDNKLDPFLLLDEFDSEESADYIGGFPPHPHRGFETVTYMLEGEMLHEDHLGNQGRLTPGSVQWMTAARGIIHSEMPQQIEGRMRGFQLWINLPAAEKMKNASYQDISPEAIPAVAVLGGRIKIIAGRLQLGAETITGAVQGVSTDPLYLDTILDSGADIELPVSHGHTAIVYVYQGTALVADQAVATSRLATLGDGTSIHIKAGENGTRALVLAAKPLREPVVHHGPFVMNTRAEIEQAIQDYQSGRLTA